MQFLRQGTAVSITMGPFVDETDGYTPETALTIQAADVLLKKAGGASAGASGEQGTGDVGAAHDVAGIYDIDLDADDTDTLGPLDVIVQKAGARVVRAQFMVMPDNAFDALFGTELLTVDANAMSGTLGAAIALIAAKTDPLPDEPAGIGDIPGAAAIRDAIAALNIPEPTQVPAANAATLASVLGYMLAKLANRTEQTAAARTLKNRAGTSTISTALVSDDGTTLVAGSET